jgi:hypothetical protein
MEPALHERGDQSIQVQSVPDTRLPQWSPLFTSGVTARKSRAL